MVFDNKYLLINRRLWTNICLITGLLIIFSTHTISKILRKVITAHNVAYKSQKWKGMHLIDRNRLSNINSRVIHKS